MTENGNSDFTAAIEAGQELGKPKLADADDIASGYAVVPCGSELRSLEKLFTAPRRKRGCPTFAHESGFNAYVKDHKDEGSRIFADIAEQTMCAVLDGHFAGGAAARWCQHRAIFAPPKDADWLAWVGAHDKQMPQLKFAQFIEDMLPTVVKPDGAELLEVAQHLEAKTNVTFKSAQRLQDGNRALVYEEQVSGKVGKGNIEIPEELVLKLPVFVKGDKIELLAKLRYRIADGGLILWVHLHRHEEVLLEAFQRLVDGVDVETHIRPMFGTPGKLGDV